jgi:hypothetical protein
MMLEAGVAWRWKYLCGLGIDVYGGDRGGVSMVTPKIVPLPDISG